MARLTRIWRFLLRSIFPTLTLVLAVHSSAVAQCRPGDVLIGEDDNNYYCSTRNCEQIAAQLGRDQDAIKRLRDSMLAGNKELDEWSKRNADAADNALKDATKFLGTSTVSALKNLGTNQLAAVEKEFKRKMADGFTWQMHLERLHDLRSRSAKLHGAVDGLKLATLPGVNPDKWWEAVKGWAKDSQGDADGITQSLGEIRKDPAANQILNEHNVSFAADVMALALSSVVKNSLSFGKFIVAYGYDATEWVASKNRIEQNILNQDQNRIAMCRLTVQLQKTVRDANICKKKYPADNETPPDPSKCR